MEYKEVLQAANILTKHHVREELVPIINQPE